MTKKIVRGISLGVMAAAMTMMSAGSSQALPARYLNGTFIQIEGATSSWSTTQFNPLLINLSTVKMDHVILQYIAKTDTHQVYYPKTFTTLGGVTWTQANPGKDPVLACLSAAKAKNMKVWLGLGWDATNWFNNNPATFAPWQSDDTYMNREFETYDVPIAKDLWDKYKGTYSATIAGFYFPEEVDNITTKLSNYAQYKTHLTHAVTAIKAYTGKPIMIAPFFVSSGQSATTYATDMASVVTTTGVDVIAVQDGIGANNVAMSDLSTWFSALKTKFNSSGIANKLWSDLETFDTSYNPAAISRVTTQITTETPSVVTFTSFTFAQYDTPDFGHTTEYNAYKAWMGIP